MSDRAPAADSRAAGRIGLSNVLFAGMAAAALGHAVIGWDALSAAGAVATALYLALEIRRVPRFQIVMA
ncbi:MAG: hypothetical protein VW405_08095, partial [Rhodospirillaceae bacterium]